MEDQYGFDREKYLTIFRNQGLASALTALHQELWNLEFESMEGADGYRPDLYKQISRYRDFSRELWNLERGIPENQ